MKSDQGKKKRNSRKISLTTIFRYIFIIAVHLIAYQFQNLDENCLKLSDDRGVSFLKLLTPLCSLKMKTIEKMNLKDVASSQFCIAGSKGSFVIPLNEETVLYLAKLKNIPDESSPKRFKLTGFKNKKDAYEDKNSIQYGNFFNSGGDDEKKILLKSSSGEKVKFVKFSLLDDQGDSICVFRLTLFGTVKEN